MFNGRDSCKKGIIFSGKISFETNLRKVKGIDLIWCVNKYVRKRIDTGMNVTTCFWEHLLQKI